jgi:hypothetical protein
MLRVGVGCKVEEAECMCVVGERGWGVEAGQVQCCRGVCLPAPVPAC